MLGMKDMHIGLLYRVTMYCRVKYAKKEIKLVLKKP